MTRHFSTGRATVTAAGWQSPDQEVPYPSLRLTRRCVRGRRSPHGAGALGRFLADHPGGARIPVPAGMAEALRRLLSTPARVRRLASRVRRLGRPTVSVLGRSSVPPLDVDGTLSPGRRARVAVVDPRAGVSRISGLVG